MITSFKLPDLVLGVSVRADVTGARTAARDIKRAVASEFRSGTGAGMGGGAGGLGSSLLGGFAGNALGSWFGSRKGAGTGLPTKATLKRGMGFSPGMAATSVASVMGNLNSPANMARRQFGLQVFDIRRKIRNEKNAIRRLDYAMRKEKISRDVWIKQRQVLQHNVESLKWQKKGMSSIGYIAGERALGSPIQNLLARVGANNKNLLSGTGRGAGKMTGLFGRGLQMTGLGGAARLLGLTARGGVIGAVLAAIVVSVWTFVKGLRAAADAIRRSTLGPESPYKKVVSDMDELSASWNNLWIQIGLMTMKISPLIPAISAMGKGFRILGSSLEAMTPFMEGMKKLNPIYWGTWLMDKILPETAGGIDLPTAGGMAPGAVEGSVEAYRSIYGSLSYEKQTAQNTAEIRDIMKAQSGWRWTPILI